MNRTLALALIFSTLVPAASAYEKIDFKTQILSPAFLKPSAVAVSDRKVFVADSKANAVFIFDADGKQTGKTEGGLKSPEALDFGGGRLYVADTGNSRVAVFDADGKQLWTFAGEGSAPGQLDSPSGLAYGPDGRLYVSDTGHSRVDVFNSDGIYLYGFPTARADGVIKINPGKISLNRSGEIFVSDQDKGVLQKYDRSGKLLREFTMPNNGSVEDQGGMLYLINPAEGRVVEFSETSGIVGTFGTRGKGKSEFRDLRDIAMDAEGDLYLCDADNKKIVEIRLVSAVTRPALPPAVPLDRFVLKGPSARFAFKAGVFAVTPDGKIVAYMPGAREIALLAGGAKKTLVPEGKLQGQVRSPRGIFVDAKGMIYVADTGNDRVQIFNPDGTYSNMFGGSGSGDGEFRSPSAVAVNPVGNIYVADTRNHKIKAFSHDGIFLFSVGPVIGDVTLQDPVSIAFGSDNNVYVLDSGLKKVIVTDAMGKFLRLWDDSGSLQDPASLDYDGKGFFYVLDRGTYNVKIFGQDGKLAASFFAKGRGERELWAPAQLAFRSGKLYISDPDNSRVLAFDVGYIPEAPTGLTAEAGAKGVKLSWQAVANGWTDGFRVYRSTRPGEAKEAGSSKDEAFADNGLSAAATYYYRVASLAVNGVPGILSDEAAVYYAPPEAPKPAEAAPAADNKNVAPMEILPVELNYIFSANYKHYQNNPVGRIAVKNNTDSDFTNVKLSFNLKDFMDFPSDTVVPLVKAHSQVNVDLMATLNNRMLNITEDTPIQCQLTLTYYQDGAEKTYTLNQPVKVLSKNAIIWDKADRLANFITANDTPVFSFSRTALLQKPDFAKDTQYLNDNLITADMAWEALGEYGMTYISEAVSPFEVIKSSKAFPIDTVHFPRTTLKLKSGNCADLTALFASILEGTGLHTALLDYPAHIAMMFDTGVTDARDVGLPEEYLIKYNNTWWVGVETTMLGKSFYDAIKHEADLYRSMPDDVKVVDVRKAWTEFAPVTLPDAEAETYPDKAAVDKRVAASLAALEKVRYDYLKKYFSQILLEAPDDVDANINMGILLAQNGENDAAVKYLDKVLEKDPVNASAFNNLGNISFSGGKYEEARGYYFKASKADPFDAGIWLNLARVADKQGKKDDVKAFVEKAGKLDPSVKATGDKLLN